MIHILVQKWHNWENILAQNWLNIFQTGWIWFKKTGNKTVIITASILCRFLFSVFVVYVVWSDSIFAFLAATEVFVGVGEVDVEDDSAIDRLQPARQEKGRIVNVQKLFKELVTKNMDSLE